MRAAVLMALTGLFLFGSPVGFPAAQLTAAETGDPELAAKGIAAASDEGERAMRSFTVPQGLEVELIAAEPHMANPVAFDIDEQGRIYVVETFRHGNGVLDIRGRRGWPGGAFRESASEERMDRIGSEMLDVDLAAKTVDERIAYLKKYFGDGKVAGMGEESDRVRLLWDSDGDRVMDQSTVFTDGFDNIADGLAAGVLARHGNVWFASLPELWLLNDQDDDGVADRKQLLHYGLGVRSGFLGHDLHGLEFGPDGKLYFSIGDRGALVRTGVKERLDVPDAGAVFRCNPDGSDLEVFAYGLRNPQELTFDQHGNLFTGDNNSDGGDQARWVHVVEGGDSGWRIGFQFLEGNTSPFYSRARGPWNAEKMWHEQNPEQPASIIPPIANIGNGPSGVTFYPGTGLAESFNGQFFMVDFKGQASISGVHTFDLMPRDASFRVGYLDHFIWNILATDADFGVDGGLYVSDWVAGWNKTGKGRIYRVFDPGLEGDELVVETRGLLAEGMRNRSGRQLQRLLGHQDYRIRLDAQYELARRGEDSIDRLSDAARQTRTHLARLHGIWGLGQILNQFRNVTSTFDARDEAIESLIDLLDDDSEFVRSQAAKVLGDAQADEAFEDLIALTQDNEPKVRFHATMALGKLNRQEAIPAIFEMLRNNNNEDPLLRHAGVMALARLKDVDALIAAENDASAGVRMASMIALRRLQREEVELFLDDESPYIVREAVRSINDEPINGAMLALARLEHVDWNDIAIAPRVINACFRLGIAETANRLASIATNPDIPEAARVDSLLALAEWPEPSGRDRVTGVWQPLIQSSRDRHIPAEAVQPVISDLLSANNNDVISAALTAVESLHLEGVDTRLAQLVSNADVDEDVRVQALNILARNNSSELESALVSASNAEAEPLRSAASSIRARTGGGNVLEDIQTALESGSMTAQQNAIATLAELKAPEATQILMSLVNQLGTRDLKPELELDVINAAEQSDNEEIKSAVHKAVADYSEASGELGAYRTAMYGGDPEAGRSIFFSREDVACLRCHKIGGEGGEVGPVLDGLAGRVDRQYLMESIVMPNKVIAEGFENVILETEDGTWYAGMIQSEEGDELVLNSPEDGIIHIKKSEIVTRERGASGMPEGLGLILTRSELRDLIAYLATLK